MALKSPIEIKLRDAIRARCPHNVMLDDYTEESSMPVLNMRSVVYRNGIENTALEVFGEADPERAAHWVDLYSDVQVDRYKADLLICCDANGGNGWLAIECDGFEFHDRTVAQASRDRARDRALLNRDVPIQTIRFTGSEIHHDADACAVEIWSLIARAWRQIEIPELAWRHGHDVGRSSIQVPQIAPEEHW